jgi:hypothetical protein
MQERPDPISLAVTAFIAAGLAGVAALLRTSTKLTVRTVLSALLNAGALGAGLAMLLFTWLGDNTWFLIGLCMLAGLGGMTALGFVLAVIRQGGVNLHIDVRQDDEKGDDDGNKKA